MKKLITMVCAVALAGIAQAATVSWSMAGGSACAGSAYDMFVIGQNGVTSVDQITALIDAGTSVSTYAFGTGNANASGLVSVSAAASGKTLGEGTHTAFFVVFDNASIADASKYLLVSSAALTKVIGATTPSVAFAAGNQTSFAGTASNWKSFGAVPEPTSGLLLLLGMAGLALKRKVA